MASPGSAPVNSSTASYSSLSRNITFFLLAVMALAAIAAMVNLELAFLSLPLFLNALVAMVLLTTVITGFYMLTQSSAHYKWEASSRKVNKSKTTSDTPRASWVIGYGTLRSLPAGLVVGGVFVALTQLNILTLTPPMALAACAVLVFLQIAYTLAAHNLRATLHTAREKSLRSYGRAAKKPEPGGKQPGARVSAGDTLEAKYAVQRGKLQAATPSAAVQAPAADGGLPVLPPAQPVAAASPVAGLVPVSPPATTAPPVSPPTTLVLEGGDVASSAAAFHEAVATRREQTAAALAAAGEALRSVDVLQAKNRCTSSTTVLNIARDQLLAEMSSLMGGLDLIDTSDMPHEYLADAKNLKVNLQAQITRNEDIIDTARKNIDSYKTAITASGKSPTSDQSKVLFDTNDAIANLEGQITVVKAELVKSLATIPGTALGVGVASSAAAGVEAVAAPAPVPAVVAGE